MVNRLWTMDIIKKMNIYDILNLTIQQKNNIQHPELIENSSSTVTKTNEEIKENINENDDIEKRESTSINLYNMQNSIR